MATRLSEYGIGAIKDPSTFAINISGGSAIVKPMTPNQLVGWLHFAIPNLPVDYPDLASLSIKFSSHSATAASVLVFLANHKVFDESNLQQTASFNLEIASTKATYKGDGIAVSIKLVFTSVAGTLKLQSVGVEVQASHDRKTRCLDVNEDSCTRTCKVSRGGSVTSR
ncbi:hypothetical protein BHYA_0754g00030 [Botrytis hyacinthi]|uniref:Uncharacterized protein n=1 Tax=Botrytis hyacinthi TaxID=278943 RepID=A0A4Z1G335_9HELO|nr:hypothetical protein BHYA_0754g00030 [Botrytis hyacinthi]